MFDKMFDLSNEYFVTTMIMFSFNMLFLFLLIRLVYYRYSKKESFLFALFVIGVVVFFIGSLLNAVQIQWQLAVGLVAIFTILRFRTRSITVKDMSYIFAVIGISVLNSLNMLAFPLLGKVIINLIIIITPFILEEFLLRNRNESYRILYENLDLLRQGKTRELLQDLSTLTGRNVQRYKVLEVDYKKKISELEVFYKV
jgi:hypothetical protein